MTKTFALAVCCIAAVAFAGKPERDKEKELTPKLAEQAAQIKEACGCEVKMSPKWDSYPKAGDMGRIKSCAEQLATVAKKFCESPEDKKAFCGNVKEMTMTYSKGDVGKPELTDKVLACHSNDMSYNSDAQLKQILDKL
jgi:hypothetical protein